MSVKNRPNITTKLESGLILEYPPELDGGGLEERFDFLELIRQHGKSKYNRTFEWCSGFGAIGFEILGFNLTDELYFSDCYDLAIYTCLQNSEKNNVGNKVFGIVSSKISTLPNFEPWDLVVANPPHVSNKEAFIKGLMEYGNHREISELVDLDTALRLTLDEGFKIHKEFFQNIRPRLTDDADIFISESEVSEELISFAESNGLKLCGNYPASFNRSQGRILHFKASELS